MNDAQMQIHTSDFNLSVFLALCLLSCKGNASLAVCLDVSLWWQAAECADSADSIDWTFWLCLNSNVW